MTNNENKLCINNQNACPCKVENSFNHLDDQDCRNANSEVYCRTTMPYTGKGSNSGLENKQNVSYGCAGFPAITRLGNCAHLTGCVSTVKTHRRGLVPTPIVRMQETANANRSAKMVLHLSKTVNVGG